MLSDEERREIEAEVKHYEHAQAACIEAMKIVQRHRGWVSDEDIRDIGEMLNMSTADLDGVATFYNLIFRRPVGKHVIMVCNSISCWVMGYDAMLERLKSSLGIDYGQTTGDGRFTLLPIVCLGTCDHAPALMIDDDLHQDVEPGKIDAILEQYR